MTRSFDPYQAAIDRLCWAFKTLEECADAGVPLLPEVVFFLGALDRTFGPEERAYVAMVFAAHKGARDVLTAELQKRFGMTRGAVIAAVDCHLREAAAATGAIAGYLDRLRQKVLAITARAS
jgi:hypothetical protein